MPTERLSAAARGVCVLVRAWSACRFPTVGVWCLHTNDFGVARLPHVSVLARSVLHMTTTALPRDDDMATHVLMRFSRCTHTMTAEYHPDDDGMPYVLCIIGGKHSGTVIHCMTEQSVVRLFNEVVALHHLGIEHPYLVAV